MSVFKDMVERDVKSVFQSADFFAEKHNVFYGSKSYCIAIILDNFTERERKKYVDDHAQGVFREEVMMYATYADMNVLPKKGQRIWIDDKEYRIAQSACEMGQIALKLEAYNE